MKGAAGEEVAKRGGAVTALADDVTTLVGHLVDALLKRHGVQVRNDTIGSPSGCSQRRVPPPLDALCRELDSIVTAHNALVERHNRLVEGKAVLTDEHRRTLAVTNDLIDARNWTR